MAPTIALTADAVEVHARDLVWFDEADAHLSIPYACIRAVRVGPYTPPAGTLPVDGREVAYAEVRAGHHPLGAAWCFAAYDDPERTLILDLAEFEFALRPYARVVLGTDDAAALKARIDARLAGARAATEDPGSAEVAWTALGAGDPVYDRDGRRIGTVSHPLGDLEADLFEGVAFREGAFGPARMAAPSAIERLGDDGVHLNLTADEARALPPVALEDLREVAPGRGIFRHRLGWRRPSGWDDGER
jgi:hypothetical protein